MEEKQAQDIIFTTDKKKHQVYGCILFAKQQKTFLIVNNKKGFWEFPKGYPEPYDKSFEAAALRELQEETGIDPKLVQIEYSIGNIQTQYLRYGQYPKTSNYLLCYVEEEQKLKIQEEEVSEAIWADSETVKTKLKFDELQTIFSKVCNFLNKNLEKQ